jgi:hypothetical protein
MFVNHSETTSGTWQRTYWGTSLAHALDGRGLLIPKPEKQEFNSSISSI